MLQPRLLQPLREHRRTGLAFRIVRGDWHEHADVSHSITRLLRARRERPADRRAADEPDELPPLHVPCVYRLCRPRIDVVETAKDGR